MSEARQLTDKEKFELHNQTNQLMKAMVKQSGKLWKHIVLEMHKRIIADAFKDRPTSDLNKYFTDTKKSVKDTIPLILAMQNKVKKNDEDASQVKKEDVKNDR